MKQKDRRHSGGSVDDKVGSEEGSLQGPSGGPPCSPLCATQWLACGAVCRDIAILDQMVAFEQETHPASQIFRMFLQIQHLCSPPSPLSGEPNSINPPLLRFAKCQSGGRNIFSSILVPTNVAQ